MTCPSLIVVFKQEISGMFYSVYFRFSMESLLLELQYLFTLVFSVPNSDLLCALQ